MDQEKFGNFIKTIRKNNNLTQKEFADKYGVTYQAVSKWERGLNMPDTALIKQMSKDFNISIEELLEGKYTSPKKKTHNLIIGLSVIIIVFIIAFFVMFKPFKSNNDFQFKTISSSCDAFTISGSIAYNASKTAISITNIKYCGGNDEQEYKMIECSLYESHDNILKKISTYKTEQERIKLEDFLQKVTLSVDNYQSSCSYFEKENLYLSINATDYNNKTTTYKVPLKLDNCN